MNTETMYKYRNYLRQEIANGEIKNIKDDILYNHLDNIESIGINYSDLKINLTVNDDVDIEAIRQTVYNDIVKNCSESSIVPENEKEEYKEYLNSGIMLFDFYRIGQNISFSF